jgi:hypothetical protein
MGGAAITRTFSGSKETDPPLPGRASRRALAQAEEQIGFALPGPLRDALGSVANGGFGPGGGLAPLEAIVSTYLAFRAATPSRGGQPWPAELLPITDDNPGRHCIDQMSGKIVFWDEEALAAAGGDKVWKKSFAIVAPDLEVWLRRWLETRSPEQRIREGIIRAHEDQQQRMLAHWRSKTPAERADAGLPNDGWEAVILARFAPPS